MTDKIKGKWKKEEGRGKKENKDDTGCRMTDKTVRRPSTLLRINPQSAAKTKEKERRKIEKGRYNIIKMPKALNVYSNMHTSYLFLRL